MNKSFDEQRAELRKCAAESLKPVSAEEAARSTRLSKRTFNFSPAALERMDNERTAVEAALHKK
jgi:hypothetical protein